MASFEAVVPLTQAGQQLASTLAAGRRLFEIVDQPPAVAEPIVPAPTPRAYDIAVRDLTFRYSADQPPALAHVSFDVPAGGRLAIVGPSGAGKTTLMNLLLRLWAAPPDAIRIGGVPIAAMRGDDVRALIGVVAQRTHLFAGTIRENLRLARPDATPEELGSAARQAEIDDFIQGLPDGYDTWVGEHGLRLSGGERQRIAIARALLRAAPILVLDEPTSQLDGPTAAAIRQTLHAALDDRTIIASTHQLTDLAGFDAILVLDAGRIVERGTHAQLLAARGLYWRMWVEHAAADGGAFSRTGSVVDSQPPGSKHSA